HHLLQRQAGEGRREPRAAAHPSFRDAPGHARDARDGAEGSSPRGGRRQLQPWVSTSLSPPRAPRAESTSESAAARAPATARRPAAGTRARSRGRGSSSSAASEGAAPARAGFKFKRGCEGGQMPLHRRVPKRGFTNIFRTEFAVVNVDRIAEVF